jgi:hypothetical protein
MEVSGQRHAPGYFIQAKKVPGNHIGGWVGSADVNHVERIKIDFPCLERNPETS